MWYSLIDHVTANTLQNPTPNLRLGNQRSPCMLSISGMLLSVESRTPQRRRGLKVEGKFRTF